MTPIT